jgi:DNA-binding XRE family transcriptional regulator
MKSFSTLKKARLSDAARARVAERARAELEELTLQGLRQGQALTQADMGKALEMSQSQLSRLESRSDHLTSTLRRYVEALGGELEITAVIGGRRVKIKDV